METFDWLKPSPLWQKNGRDLLLPSFKDTFRRPQVLAFRGDNFIEEFFAIAATSNADDFPIAQNDLLITDPVLKLFQPAHGRFYLVCASLCCIRPGFPDRAVRLADDESVYFVLRKQQNDQEYGWVLGSNGPLGWQPISTPGGQVLAGEEQLPLAFTAAGNGRKLMFGYLPVASRDAYQALPAELPGEPVATDARLMELQGRFSQQLIWVNAVELDNPDEEADVALRLSVYMMLDLWEYLQTYLPPVGEALFTGDTSDLDGANEDLATFLDGQALGGGVSLADALHEVATTRAVLNDLGDAASLPSPFGNETADTYDYTLKNRTLDTATLETRVEAALIAADEETEASEVTVAVPKFQPDTGETFIVRCVYDRPRCSQKEYWVSQPSVVFQMAAFYDPDAPVRPVRIQLPEVSMSSLRRFKKGIGFITSQELQDKVAGINGAQVNLLSNSLSELSLGYLCTFSLPIITLCAFILLLVMVIILNIVFWWIPFLKICLPIPQVE